MIVSPFIDTQNAHERTAFHFAAFYNHLEVVNVLLAHKANVNAITKVSPSTPFTQRHNTAGARMASGRRCAAAVCLVVVLLRVVLGMGGGAVAVLPLMGIADACGACCCLPRIPPTQNGCTPLHFTAIQGYIAMAELLLAHGADRNIKDKVRCRRLRA